jgi:hypothetical protein
VHCFSVKAWGQQCAAAPDLLAALRAVQHNRSCSCYVTVGKPCARCEVGYDEVDSAIAKAEGR